MQLHKTLGSPAHGIPPTSTAIKDNYINPLRIDSPATSDTPTLCASTIFNSTQKTGPSTIGDLWKPPRLPTHRSPKQCKSEAQVTQEERVD